MEENRKKPQIRFAGYTDDWEQRKFSELTEIRSASRVHKEEWQTSGVPFYRSSDVMAALNGTENEKAFISKELYEKLSAISGKLEKGDVLVTGGGSVGKPYIVPNNEPLYTKDADLLWIKNNKNLDPYFIYTFFFTTGFKDYLSSVSHVGTIAHYTITQLGETPITLPNVSEQQRIGFFFQNLDRLITLHQRKYNKLVDVKKSMLEKMFPKNGEKKPEIRFGGFTDDWEQRKLGDLADIVGGGTPDTNNSAYWDGDIDWYAPAEMEGQRYAKGSVRKITELGLQKSSAKILPAHRTVLFTSRAGIGKMAILRRPAATNQGFQSLVLKDGTNPYFIYSMGEKIKDMAEGVASGSTFLEISGKMLGNLEVMVPNLKEQESIATFFRGIDDLITLHQREVEKLKNIKKSMLEKMFI